MADLKTKKVNNKDLGGNATASIIYRTIIKNLKMCVSGKITQKKQVVPRRNI